jgi:hypothetical protein
MGAYNSDRQFTDYVHRQLAIPLVYEPLGWKECLEKKHTTQWNDLLTGIDYRFTCNSKEHAVQERFREYKYRHYTDITIRYRSTDALPPNATQPGLHRMQADYFLYGITNGNKEMPSSSTTFMRFALLDLSFLYSQITEGRIVLVQNGQSLCTLKRGMIECPLRLNADGSPGFFSIDMTFLIRLWKNEIIIAKKGFL